MSAHQYIQSTQAASRNNRRGLFVSKMGPQVGSGLTCLWLTLCQKIRNTLWEPPTARKDPAPQETSPEPQAAAAAQFRRFSELPAELRLQIWEEATRYKRCVVLDPPFNSLGACVGFWFSEFWHREFSEYAGRRKPLWTSPTPPPALLSVSFEARQVALKVWRPSFACKAFPAAVVRAPPPLFEVIVGRVYPCFRSEGLQGEGRLWGM